MKEKVIRQAIQIHWAAACPCRICAIILLLVTFTLAAHHAARAQACPVNNVFHHGERVDYDLYYKWGLLSSKAGLASFTMTNAEYRSHDAWKYRLQFHSMGMLETFYKMRDTLTVYFSPSRQLRFSSKQTDEGGFYLLDELTFSYTGGNTSVQSYRRARSGVRIDTTLNTEGCVYDMLGSVILLRSIDWNDLKPGDEFPFKIAVGKDIVNVRFRYTGQETVKESDAQKYRANHFYIDVYDPAFTQSKEAAEAWVGDDDNHIPLRVRAKLKVGAVEVHYRESANLQYPFACRVAPASK